MATRKDYQNRNKALGAIVAVLLALIMCAAAVLGVGFGVYGKNTDDWFKPKQENQGQEQEENAEQDPIPIEVIQTNNISLLSSGATAASDGTTTKTLTATVSPSDASTLDYAWTVEFVNPSSTWAKGKTVTDYVTVTKDSSNKLKATVTYKKAFSEQIKVTVYCVLKPDMKASATVDCYKDVTDLTVTFTGATTVVCKGIGQDQDTTVTGYFVASEYTVSIDPTYSDGTLLDRIYGSGTGNLYFDEERAETIDLTSAGLTSNTYCDIAIDYGQDRIAEYSVKFYQYLTSISLDSKNIIF